MLHSRAKRATEVSSTNDGDALTLEFNAVPGAEAYLRTAQNLELFLLDASGIALWTRNVSGAWPVKWCVPPLDPGKSEILIEILELAYMQLVCA